MFMDVLRTCIAPASSRTLAPPPTLPPRVGRGLVIDEESPEVYFVGLVTGTDRRSELPPAAASPSA